MSVGRLTLRLRACLTAGLFGVTGSAGAAQALVPDAADIVAACGGLRMVVVTDAQLSVPEVEALAFALRQRLPEHGGMFSDALVSVAPDEDGRIVILMAGSADLGQSVEAFLRRSAPLSLHAVIAHHTVDTPAGTASVILPVPAGDTGFFELDAEPLIAALGIASAEKTFDYNSQPAVAVAFDAQTAQQFGDVTAAHIGEPIALRLGDELLLVPTVQEAIYGGVLQISGYFTVEEASRLADAIGAGAIAHDLRVEEQSIVPAGGGLDGVCAVLDDD